MMCIDRYWVEVHRNVQFNSKWRDWARNQNYRESNQNYVTKRWFVFKVLIWNNRNELLCSKSCCHETCDYKKLINFIETFINVKLSIDYLRVWECKCYSFIDTRSLFSEKRIDKFVNRKRLDVFMSYDESTSTHYHI